MKKLSFCIAALAIAVPLLNAQNADTTIDEAVVSGTRVPLTVSRSARMVTLIDTLFIRTAPAQTVNDLLKYAVGVDVRQRGGMGVQTDIGIRGGSADQIAVLLNGVNISDPQTGHLVMDLPVDLGEVDRIEILEGPAGRVYGTSSLLGAVNIVTKASSVPGVDLRLEGGSYGLASGGVKASLPSGKFRNQISASYTRSDGYSRNLSGRLNSDFKSVKAFYQGALPAKKADLKWHLGISAKDYGANTFYSARFDDQFEHGVKLFSAFEAEGKGFLHLKPQVYWNRSFDRFELFRGDESVVPFNYHRTDVLGANVSGWFDSRLGKTAFGAEFRHEGIVSTALGEPLSDPKDIKGSGREYSHGLKRASGSLFLEHNIILKRFTASAGLAAVHNSASGGPLRLYPGADMSFRFGAAWKVYASFNTSYRMPSFTELYYSVGGHAADKNLSPERMTAFEAGLKYSVPGVNASLSVYRHLGSDMIDWIKDLREGDDAPWVSVNHTKINSFGQEVNVSISPGIILSREDFFLRNVSAGYAHISQDKDIEEYLQSAYALEYLKHKFVAQADVLITKGLSLVLSYRWQDRVGNYEKFEGGKSTGKLVPYSPYSLLDLRINWELPSVKLYLEGNNLLDKVYFDHGNIPQPGFWFKAGMVLSIR